ncbi:MAG: hypothetical protein MH472_06455 [Bacteroidia bacterium]|nr:hypothetical protein [Bacteroidia bacterium]
MTEIIQKYIETIGASNVLAIILFFISLFVAFYLYYKTFYRLVFSTGRICKECANISEWNGKNKEFTSRILFYNNGRKTISKNEIKKLELKSTGKIISVKNIKTNDTIKTKTNTKKSVINIDIEYLDSSEFFVLEVNHNGNLEVNGRISETGNLLHTEPRFWVALNILFMVLFFVMIFYELMNTPDKNDPFTLEFITNFFIFFGIFSVLRFIHYILFIPDSISSKYLDTKDKFAKEFKS